MEKRITTLEKRVAKLEKAAMLFEEYRQSWIDLNKKLKKFKQEMDRDRRKELEREKRNKTVWKKLHQNTSRV